MCGFLSGYGVQRGAAGRQDGKTRVLGKLEVDKEGKHVEK